MGVWSVTQARRLPLSVLPSTGGVRGDGPKEKCAVFGVWASVDAVRHTYLGLYALQHRGQESTGIAISNGERLAGATGMGLVPEVFDPETILKLEASAGKRGVRGAIGHNRYSTAGGSEACNAQPILLSYSRGQIAIAHNGNLINYRLLRQQFEEAGHIFQTTSDTEAIVHLLASPEQQRAPDPLAAALRRLQGAFSLVMLFADRIEAARDPWGWRPLVLGEMPDGSAVVASETVALDVLGARLVREVEPGEIVTLSDQGVTSRRFADAVPRSAMCVFEHVYFANPASVVFGQNVQATRERLGETLAKESPPPRGGADFVVPMPDSGRSAALGYARASGLAYREAIVPNRYVGRTFIKPTQHDRVAAVRLKLNIISELVRDKRLIIVDDSIVRGTTTRAKMDQLRAAGAKEIHLRISCPPIRHPCFFGVDFAERSQLIATGRTVEEIRAYLGVDSLAYLTLEGLLSCMDRPGEHYCTACYSGEYRLDPEHPVSDVLLSEQGQLEIFDDEPSKA
ncbi:MAG: amidophosphoribosyltransferase [Phycisphaerales bacterium]